MLYSQEVRGAMAVNVSRRNYLLNLVLVLLLVLFSYVYTVCGNVGLVLLFALAAAFFILGVSRLRGLKSKSLRSLWDESSPITEAFTILFLILLATGIVTPSTWWHWLSTALIILTGSLLASFLIVSFNRK